MSDFLQVRQISFSYRSPNGVSTPVLDGLTFGVSRRERLVVVGDSGCGKTTLLNLVANLLEPEAGTILIDGRTVRAGPRQCVLLSQDPYLFPWKTTQENVIFGLKVRNSSANERWATSKRYLDRVGLAPFASYFPFQLSGGMRQRAALARALAAEPEILLLDEPFAALDSQARHELQEEFLRLQSDVGATTLLVTHDLDEALYLGDRVLVLAGRPVSRVVTVPIDLPRPRPPGIRLSYRFLELKRQLSQTMSEP